MRSLQNSIRTFAVILTILVSTVFYSAGQKTNYDEILDNLSKLTLEQAYTRLFDYRTQNPQQANPYLQLGNVSEKIIKELDPFREQGILNFYIDNAILYYDLFPHYLQANEVRRNRKNYTNIPLEAFGFDYTDESVVAYAKSRVEYCKNLKESVSSAYSALEKSKDHYNKCVNTFNAINNNYDNYNEVLLKADDKFLNLLNDLEKSFRATKESFDEYKKLLDKFPIKGYNQNYAVAPIKTFRLDGITNSDFLQDNFTLWDYGKWVEGFKATYNKDILTLRTEIESIQKQFEDNLNTLSKISVLEELELKTFDDLFLFRAGRYDSNSLIRELFNYNQKRQNFIASTKNSLNSPNDSIDALMNRKLRYYYRLSQELKSTISELELFNGSITVEKISRFENFFSKYYNGENGLRSYKDQQLTFIDNSFNSALQNLAIYIENGKALKESFTSATGEKGLTIPLNIDYFEDTPPLNSYVTEDIFYANDAPKFVSGYINKQDKKVAFVAKIGKNLSVEWVKELIADNAEIDKLSRSVKKIFGFEKGSIAIVSTDIKDSELFGDTDKQYLNTLVFLDSIGTTLKTNYLSSNDNPIYLNYDEINQLSITAFGKKRNDLKEAFSQIAISQTDSLGTTNWETTLKVSGDIAGLVKAENKFVAYLNYQEYDINGVYKLSGNNGNDWATVIVDISPEGQILNTKPIESKESFFIDRVYSISSNEVNLLGYSGSPNQKGKNFKYFVYSTEGDQIFSNTNY
jgi:hypothetical protein